MNSDHLDKLAAALCAAQSEFDTVSKDSTNPFFKSKYAGLPEVMKTAGPVLAKHGLAISQFLSHDETGDTLTTWLLHQSGQYIKDSMKLHLTKDDAQGQGSATTYARRYSYMAVLGLVADDDDDGNAASRSQKPTKAAVSPAAIEADLPASEIKKNKLRLRMAARGMKGQEVTNFVQLIINKEEPTTEAEMDQLLEALA